MEVSNDKENHPVEEKQPNDKLSNDKDEVNGNENDQVKT